MAIRMAASPTDRPTSSATLRSGRMCWIRAQAFSLPDDHRTHENYFNRTNIAIPPASSPFGNIGSNSVYGYALYQVNLMMQKNFAMPFINEARVSRSAESSSTCSTRRISLPRQRISVAQTLGA